MKGNKRYVYDYYQVDIPEDCTTDPEERANLAFLNAEEQSRIYAVPCEWMIVRDYGSTVIVRRKRLAR